MGDELARSGVSTAAATRLAYTIGTIKWLILGLIALGVVGGTAIGLAGDTQLGGAISVAIWLYGAVAGLGVYVVLGWLQQTLLMLIGIARNTARDDILSRL